MKVNFANVGGVPTRYYSAGSGRRALLLLHGVGVASDSWFRNIDALASDYFVCAPDLLGNGFTAEGSYLAGAPQAHMVNHLFDLLDHIEADRYSVVGSSFGSVI